MIFLKLFVVFSKIGIVNFGGGYAMLSLIQMEVVERNGWLTTQEFTDIVAVSQMTPGPIGINAATYVGYSAVVAEGYAPWLGVLGAAIATLSVLWLPLVVMLALSATLLRHKDHPKVKAVFSILRPTIVGLIASSALLLMKEENFGSPEHSPIQFALSVLLAVVGFLCVYRYKTNPLLLLAISAVVGIIAYPILNL